jgi:hypothetical protein
MGFMAGFLGNFDDDLGYLLRATSNGSVDFSQYQREFWRGQEKSARGWRRSRTALAKFCGAQMPKTRAAQCFSCGFNFSQQE